MSSACNDWPEMVCGLLYGVPATTLGATVVIAGTSIVGTVVVFTGAGRVGSMSARRR
ncbi:hypothetical protein Mpal_2287 [Methanosphaerula palustris E1-9c]|uniref:Uncharacterized protein n=1 Tax=Methanosphaerula palustris (strain ATCC BAA-1556 / DSM 19958 / E1-9c) TaxID=521011 RepID=B8GE72_METPE|nr:hypothetical protein Mpal_2287 [Methanosphaerula palustris E1-9c]